MKTLQEIEKDVAARMRRICAPWLDPPNYGVSIDGGYPHVEVADGLYHYVVVERGQECARLSSADYDDLLYWIFRDMTHRQAFYEAQGRLEDQDCRRIAFPRQIELMKWLGLQMGERMEQEISDILRRHPYDDEPTKALNRLRRQSGS